MLKRVRAEMLCFIESDIKTFKSTGDMHLNTYFNINAKNVICILRCRSFALQELQHNLVILVKANKDIVALKSDACPISC